MIVFTDGRFYVCHGGLWGRKKHYLQIDLTEAPREREKKLQIMIFVASLYQVTVDLNLNCNPNSREALCIHNH